MNTPELDKMSAARENLGTEEIGAFLEWLRDQGIALCTFEHVPGVPCPYSGKNYPALLAEGIMAQTDQKCPGCGTDFNHSSWIWTHDWVEDPVPEGYYPVSDSIENLLAKYAGIDLVAVENERRALLDSWRKDSAAEASVETEP